MAFFELLVGIGAAAYKAYHQSKGNTQKVEQFDDAVQGLKNDLQSKALSHRIQKINEYGKQARQLLNSPKPEDREKGHAMKIKLEEERRKYADAKKAFEQEKQIQKIEKREAQRQKIREMEMISSDDDQ